MGSLHDTEVAAHSRWISKQDPDELRRGVFRSLELKELKEILAHLHTLGFLLGPLMACQVIPSGAWQPRGGRGGLDGCFGVGLPYGLNSGSEVTSDLGWE